MEKIETNLTPNYKTTKNNMDNPESMIEARETCERKFKTLCIPRVFANITRPKIRSIMDDLKMGTIERIDIVTKKGEKFNRVYIHYKERNNTENSVLANERFTNGNEIKVVYDSPWFWKISAFEKRTKTIQ